jgi:hypothetical protein
MGTIVVIDQERERSIRGGIDDFQPELPNPRSVVAAAASLASLGPPPPLASLGWLVVTNSDESRRVYPSALTL